MKKATFKNLKRKADGLFVFLKYFYAFFLSIALIFYGIGIDDDDLIKSLDIFILIAIISLLILLVFSYYFDLMFKMEIGRIPWKNTLSLGILIIFLFSILFEALNQKTFALIPIYIALIVLLSWIYFEQERQIINDFSFNRYNRKAMIDKKK